MTCLSVDRQAQYQAELEQKQTQMTALNTAIASGVLHIEMISFDSGEGKQVTKYRSAKALIEAQELLQSQIDRLINILGGTGLVNLNLRRKGGTE